MTRLQTMYPGVANSPETFLKEALTIDGTIMYLADGSVLGEIPTLAVIGEGQHAETVLVTSTRSDGGFTIERGVEGSQKAWTKATTVARNWTNKDYETLVKNIEATSTYIDIVEENASTAYNDLEKRVNFNAEKKVDKVDGKGLSTNDYTDAAKKKVDAIPEDPKYTDTVQDLSPYAKKEDIKTRLADMTSDSTHRTVTDEEKKKWNGKVDAVNGKGLSTNDYTDAAKDKVDAIPPNPKYTDTVSDLTPYAKIADVNTAMADKADKDAILDKRYLYDILMGESLVTKKAGEWPKVHGKPTSIVDSTFRDAQLTSVVIPLGVTSIGRFSFWGNKLTSVIIPPSVTSIGNGAFRHNQLINVVIPQSITMIDRFVFYDNKLTSVVIPPSVTKIEDGAFANNQLTEVRASKNCTIGAQAFDADVNIIRY